MRCILHIDIDCFYVQVEMLRLGLPPERPVAVTQKFLVVTCSYAARAAGVTKLMATEEAQQRCPDLLLVSGEDLTPYREASDAVFGELCEVCTSAPPHRTAALPHCTPHLCTYLQR